MGLVSVQNLFHDALKLGRRAVDRMVRREHTRTKTEKAVGTVELSVLEG